VDDPVSAWTVLIDAVGVIEVLTGILCEYFLGNNKPVVDFLKLVDHLAVLAITVNFIYTLACSMFITYHLQAEYGKPKTLLPTNALTNRHLLRPYASGLLLQGDMIGYVMAQLLDIMT
jgi:hypothetical protein